MYSSLTDCVQHWKCLAITSAVNGGCFNIVSSNLVLEIPMSEYCNCCLECVSTLNLIHCVHGRTNYLGDFEKSGTFKIWAVFLITYLSNFRYFAYYVHNERVAALS